jgi:hypothetical protein
MVSNQSTWKVHSLVLRGSYCSTEVQSTKNLVVALYNIEQGRIPRLKLQRVLQPEESKSGFGQEFIKAPDVSLA